MIGPGVIDRVPNFVRASSPERLREAMLELNIKNSGEIHFFDIQFVNTQWIAWYIPIDPKKDPVSSLPAVRRSRRGNQSRQT